MRKTLSLALAALVVPNEQLSRQAKILDPDAEERRDQANSRAACATPSHMKRNPSEYYWHRRFVVAACVDGKWVFFRFIEVKTNYYKPWYEDRRLPA